MTTTLEIGGKKRKFNLDAGFAYDYELKYGRRLDKDFSSLDGSVVTTANILFDIFSLISETNNEPIDYTPRDVSIWVVNEKDKVAKMMQIVTAAFGVIIEDSDLPEQLRPEGEKKMTAAIIGEG